ncbi:MAG: respiratory nitrate reductase subunit gamma, partial [Pseudomonadales bacterium]
PGCRSGYSGDAWRVGRPRIYLWSILALSPKTQAIAAMPLVIKLHVVGAFLIVLIFPFTRLVHLLVAPLHYLWRPYQVVMWYWDKKLIRNPNTAWQQNRPRNN